MAGVLVAVVAMIAVPAPAAMAQAPSPPAGSASPARSRTRARATSRPRSTAPTAPARPPRRRCPRTPRSTASTSTRRSATRRARTPTRAATRRWRRSPSTRPSASRRSARCTPRSTASGRCWASSTRPRTRPRRARSPTRTCSQAWRDYLANHNRGRGVVLIGHSQGTFHLRKLIAEEIEPKPAESARLISGLLIGGNVLVKKGSTTGGDFQRTPACTGSTQTGCVVAYSTYNRTPPDNTRFGKYTPPRGPARRQGGAVHEPRVADGRVGAGDHRAAERALPDRPDRAQPDPVLRHRGTAERADPVAAAEGALHRPVRARARTRTRCGWAAWAARASRTRRRTRAGACTSAT